jgi:hypothetical protein
MAVTGEETEDGLVGGALIARFLMQFDALMQGLSRGK